MTKPNAVLAAGLWGAFMSAALAPSEAQAQEVARTRHAHAGPSDTKPAALAELDAVTQRAHG